MSKPIHLVHLYPKEMNIYGDTGNRLILQRRMEARGIQVRVSHIGVAEKLPADTDIIVGGGGQDAGQGVVQDDLAKKAGSLQHMCDDGIVMLMVCGLYQLFGREFVTSESGTIKGIGVLPLRTVAGPVRLIGNTTYSSEWGQLVGYENHSGLTYLDDTELAFARVSKGAGNNDSDGTEGCIVNNVFGTYSHGPVLSKNPVLADELIRRVLDRKYGESEIQQLDDSLELQAAKVARSLTR